MAMQEQMNQHLLMNWRENESGAVLCSTAKCNLQDVHRVQKCVVQSLGKSEAGRVEMVVGRASLSPIDNPERECMVQIDQI